MNDKMPRVALFLSGLPRSWKPCLQTQKDLLRDYPHDIFFHFWDTIDAQEKTEIIDLLKPRSYCFETPQDFSSFDSDATLKPDLINAPSRIASQYYSWRSVGKLVEPFKADYDVGIRSRADLQFVYRLDHILPKLKPHELVTLWWQEKSTFSDLFAVGGIEPLLYFHALFDHLRDYSPTVEFNPEILLTTHLKKRSDITVYAENDPFFFVRRPHMTHYTIEQAMLENPGRNKWLDPEVVQSYTSYHQQKKGQDGVAYFQKVQAAQLQELAKQIRDKDQIGKE